VAETEQILPGPDLLVILALRAIENTWVGAAEAYQRVEHLRIVERE
jgi:hypothetical protein